MKKMSLWLTVLHWRVSLAVQRPITYTPTRNASGEDIFYANCTKCHKPETGSVMALSSSMANKDAIIQKVQKGSMGMTAFPNIKGEPAQRLAEFILANSKPK